MFNGSLRTTFRIYSFYLICWNRSIGALCLVYTSHDGTPTLQTLEPVFGPLDHASPEEGPAALANHGAIVVVGVGQDAAHVARLGVLRLEPLRARGTGHHIYISSVRLNRKSICYVVLRVIMSLMPSLCSSTEGLTALVERSVTTATVIFFGYRWNESENNHNII